MSYDTGVSYSIGGKQVQGGLPTANQQLQFNAVTNQWEFVAAAGASLSDLEFMRDKELAGDLIKITGSAQTASPNTIVSTIPASGKTFFVIKSKTQNSNDVSSVQASASQLQNNGTSIDINQNQVLGHTTVVNNPFTATDSMVGDGALIYRIQKTIGTGNQRISASLTGWIQDT